MQLEIENKYPIDDVARLEERLRAIGATRLGHTEQADTYYGHPSRDFAETDEALRIRRTAGEARVTYKGPKLDQATKTRHEIETPLAEPDAWPALLVALGFREVATVRKQRERFELSRPPFEIEICIDRVDRVGQFAEIEIVADEAEREAAQRVLAELADELSLANPERRSYLEMLLATS